MNAELVPNMTIQELTVHPRVELEGAYVFWRRMLKESKVGSDERKHADTQTERILVAMRNRLPEEQ